MIQELGSRQERWADYIQNEVEKHICQYVDCRDCGGRFPDFIGALALGELELCCRLQDQKNAEDRARAAERKQKAEEEERKHRDLVNEEAEQHIKTATDILKNGGYLENANIELYDEAGRYICRSIVLHLLKTNGIDVPLRTQGWINERLASVTARDGRCVSARYMKSNGSRCSEKMFDCVNALIQKLAVLNTVA